MKRPGILVIPLKSDRRLIWIGRKRRPLHAQLHAAVAQHLDQVRIDDEEDMQHVLHRLVGHPHKVDPGQDLLRPAQTQILARNGGAAVGHQRHSVTCMLR